MIVPPARHPQVLRLTRKLWSCWERTHRSSVCWRSERARVPIPDVGFSSLGHQLLLAPAGKFNSIQFNFSVILGKLPSSKGACFDIKDPDFVCIPFIILVSWIAFLAFPPELWLSLTSQCAETYRLSPIGIDRIGHYWTSVAFNINVQTSYFPCRPL